MKPLAVIDVETTGLHSTHYDKIVEVAAVLLVPGQGITSEITTLVNPERDVGPTHIHNIAASDVINAPRFFEIASELADFMSGAVALAGHNVRFDVSFLRAEFGKIGIEMPEYTALDTRYLAGGGTLLSCCQEYGVDFTGQAHAALYDARATACLLEKLLTKTPDILGDYSSWLAPHWPVVNSPRRAFLPRTKGCSVVTTPTYIQRLAECIPATSVKGARSEGEEDYRALLWNVLEDGRVEEVEGDSLVATAVRWGLTRDQVKAIHLEYMQQLAKAAWADRRVTDTERREILTAAQLLGFGVLSENQLRDLLNATENADNLNETAPLNESLAGKTVCFTGECTCCFQGKMITREMAEHVVTEKGLRVMPSVTKKLDLLVVADPNTQSGKAKKAQKYGIRIIHEPVFWRTLGITVD